MMVPDLDNPDAGDGPGGPGDGGDALAGTAPRPAGGRQRDDGERAGMSITVSQIRMRVALFLYMRGLAWGAANPGQVQGCNESQVLERWLTHMAVEHGADHKEQYDVAGLLWEGALSGLGGSNRAQRDREIAEQTEEAIVTYFEGCLRKKMTLEQALAERPGVVD
jgi:hypothetical protein